MATTLLNQYKGQFKDLSYQFANASTMAEALDVLTEKNSEEPITLSRTQEGVVIAAAATKLESFTVTVAGEDSTDDVSGCAAYPESLAEVTRGNTVYLSAVADSDHSFNCWKLNDEVVSYANPYCVTIPKDEDVTSLAYTAVFQKEE